MSFSSTDSNDRPIPPAFLESGGEVAFELREPILFGERAYYLPSQDLARLSASYESIRDVHGKESADSFVLNIRTKARYYKESDQELSRALASDTIGLTEEAADAQRSALIENHYLAARRRSAEQDLQGTQALTCVQSQELGEKFRANETSVLERVGERQYRGRTFWVAPNEFRQESETELSDRGLQNPQKLSRYFENSGKPKDVAVLNFSGSEAKRNFDVVDPDSSKARENEAQHIPFGYSSGGWREFTITPKPEYVSQLVDRESKSQGTNATPQSFHDGINRRINQDTFGDNLDGIVARKTAQSEQSALSLSFEDKNSSYNLTKYERDVTQRLSQTETAKEGRLSSVESGQRATDKTGPPTKGNPEESAAQTKSRYLESMKKNSDQKVEGKSKGAAPKV